MSQVGGRAFSSAPFSGSPRGDRVTLVEGKAVDFGKTADDYATHRLGFPDQFFQDLTVKNYVRPTDKVLDLGTGTGTIAIGLAQRKMCSSITGLDISLPMLEQAEKINQQLNLTIEFKQGSAEKTDLPSKYFDVVIAGQCWHWFKPETAIPEVTRILKPHGKLIIAHYDWIPFIGSVARLSEELILKHNPNWRGANSTGFYPQWATQLVNASYGQIVTQTFDEFAPYNHDSWRGRIRASAGVSGSMSIEEVEKFDNEHKKLLEEHFPDFNLPILHRCFILSAVPPETELRDKFIRKT